MTSTRNYVKPFSSEIDKLQTTDGDIPSLYVNILPPPTTTNAAGQHIVADFTYTCWIEVEFTVDEESYSQPIDGTQTLREVVSNDPDMLCYLTVDPVTGAMEDDVSPQKWGCDYQPY